jgi:tRNA(Ile)-lysidine synthase TilS/MesJ
MNRKKETVFVLPNGIGLSSRQFCSYFEKKVLRTIKRFSLISNFRKENLKEVISALPEKEKKAGKFIILNDSLDDIASGVLDAVSSDIKKLSKLTPGFRFKNKIFIRPFCLMEKREIELYAELKGMKIRDKRIRNLALDAPLILDKIEKKHPEIKHAVVNSFLQISELV